MAQKNKTITPRQQTLEMAAQELLEATNFPFEVLRNEVSGGAAWAKRAPKILLTMAAISPRDSLAQAKHWKADGEASTFNMPPSGRRNSS